MISLDRWNDGPTRLHATAALRSCPRLDLRARGAWSEPYLRHHAPAHHRDWRADDARRLRVVLGVRAFGNRHALVDVRSSAPHRGPWRAMLRHGVSLRRAQ